MTPLPATLIASRSSAPAGIRRLLLMGALVAGALCAHGQGGADDDRVVLVGCGERTVPKGAAITQLDEEAYSQDLMDIVAKAAGIKYQLVIYDTWGLMVEDLKSGKIDVMPTVAHLPEREGSMLFTVPHVQGGLVLVTRNGYKGPSSVAGIGDLHLVLEKGTLQYAYASKHGWVAHAIVPAEVRSGEDLRLVANGTADATILNEFSAIALIHRLDLDDQLSIAMTLPDSIVDFCMAVSPKNPHLVARLNEGILLAQRRGELKKNFDKWVSPVGPKEASRLRRWALIVGLAVASIGLAAWGWFRLTLVNARRRTAEVAKLVEARTSELAAANALLRSSEEKFSKAFMASPDAICIVQIDNAKYIDVNESFVATFGFSRSETIGRTAMDLDIWLTIKERERLVGILRKEGHVRNAPYFFKRKGGEIRSGLVSLEAIKIGGSDCMVAIMRDVTDAERADAALRESEARFRTLVESAPEAIIVFEADTRLVTDANENALRMFEATREKLVGCEVDRLHPSLQPDGRPSDAILKDMVTRTLSGETPVIEWSALGLNGKQTPVELRLARLPSVNRNLIRGLLSDITERRRLEEQLRQSQRMESIGQLAGGIAHDFNNILTVIQCTTSLLKEDKQFPAAYHEAIGQIEQSSTFAAGLTRQLLVFSRKQVIQRTSVNVVSAIQQTTRLLRRVIGENIALDVQAPANLPPIFADNGMVEQVLLNLAVNARDAMPRGGKLSIKAGLVERDEAYRRRMPQAKTGKFICISVADTGTGISPEILPRIFDPFFTTKELGKGTGLGLATVYGIVQQHQGWIEIDSTVGVGTEFRVHFVCMEAVSDAHSPSEREGAFPPKAGTILVVEDEAFVRATSCSVLKREGYRVLDAASAQAALEIWRGSRAEIDLVFTDIVMPGSINGRELVDQLREDKPDLKALFTSGYSSNLLGSDFTNTPLSFFLQKPFGVAELKRAIAECLHSSG